MLPEPNPSTDGTGVGSHDLVVFLVEVANECVGLNGIEGAFEQARDSRTVAHDGAPLLRLVSGPEGSDDLSRSAERGAALLLELEVPP